MVDLLALLALGAALAAIAGALVWLGVRVRRRGISGEIMNPIDEIYHPAAYRFRLEIEVQEERASPSPDDQWRPPAARSGRPVGARRSQPHTSPGPQW